LFELSPSYIKIHVINFFTVQFCLSNGEEMDYPRERERYENSAHYVRSVSQWGDGGAAQPEGYLGRSSKRFIQESLKLWHVVKVSR
jgi:hypothetical protein